MLRTSADESIIQTDGFSIGMPPGGFEEFPLGEDVVFYGFPWFASERSVTPRLMKGHIQSKYSYTSAPYKYAALELAFPAFPGMSGAPVFGDWNRREVIGVVTEGVRYSSQLGDEKVEAYWAVVASLTPLTDWIEST